MVRAVSVFRALALPVSLGFSFQARRRRSGSLAGYFFLRCLCGTAALGGGDFDFDFVFDLAFADC